MGQEKLGVNHPSLSIIAHRGPDGQGMQKFQLNDKFLSLGHRRLSIIDLSDNASQPMSYHDSGLWITYNGEIYNYLELKTELQQFGYEFRTNSDTEVLLASYHKWGENCLKKLNGMFAFSIWNNKTKILFVARDRYGIKPLYYWNSLQGLAIVSEIKQLTTFFEFKASINPEAAFQFLQYGDFSYNEQTLWKNVLELEPGTMFLLDLNKWKPGDILVPRKWYDFESYLFPVPINEAEAVEKFRNLLEDSIKLRLRSDVQLGLFLSGGLDSSSILCFVNKHFQQDYPLRTFSAYYKESAFSEKEFIDAVLEQVSVQSKKILFRPTDMRGSIDAAIWHSDLPTVGRSVFVQYLLYQAVYSSKIKVILEGQGADEVIAGYGSYFWSFLSELLLAGHIMTAIREYRGYRKKKFSSAFIGIRSFSEYLFPSLHKMYKSYFQSTSQTNSYLNFQELQLEDKNQAPKIIRQNDSTKKTLQSRMTILRAILHYVDRSSMAHSVETRVPFLDYRLVEFCMSLPSSLKIKDGIGKYILRQAMESILPAKTKNRSDKVGFSSPESVWACGELNDFYREELSKLNEIPFIKSKVILKSFEKFTKGLIPYDSTFTRLINFQRWLSIFKISI